MLKFILILLSQKSRSSFLIKSQVRFCTTQRYWTMTKKDTTGLPGANPNSDYFIQRLNNWYSNEAGKKYFFSLGKCFTLSCNKHKLIRYSSNPL